MVVSANSRPAVLASSAWIFGMGHLLRTFLSCSGLPFRIPLQAISCDPQFDRRHRLQIVAEPGFDGSLPGPEIVRPAVLEHHRYIMPWHDNAARAAAPERPNCRDGFGGDGGVVGHVGPPGEEFNAILGGIAGKDHI